MPTTRSRGIVAVVGVVLGLAILTAGCARGGSTLIGESEPASSAAVVRTPTPTRAPAPASTAAPASGATTTPPPPPQPTPTPAPLASPDLSAIQQLLDDLDAALGADATADNDEGSPN